MTLILSLCCSKQQGNSFSVSSIFKFYSFTIHALAMHYKKNNIKHFQINQVNYRNKFNNPLLAWGLLIGLLYIFYAIKYRANQWNAPTVKPNETGMSISKLYSV